jgi:RHS repeat-associated protein
MLTLNRLKILSARFALIILLIVMCTLEVLSQTSVNAHPDRGISPFGSYSVSDVENISLSNGAVNLAIPLASLPPIAGGKLSLTFKAYYSSKIWDTRSGERRQPGGDEPPHPYYYVSVPTQSNLGGWRLSNRYEITSVSASNEYSIGNGDHPDSFLLQSYPWHKTYLVSPDGSSHELRPLGYPSFWGSDASFEGYFKDSPITVGHPIAYYTSDGSYIWAKLYPRTSNSNDNDLFSEVYLPDGTKIIENMGGIQRIVDTNGNAIKIFSDANGTHYQDELTGREIKYVCANANQCQVMYQTVGGGWASIDINFGTTSVRGQFYDVVIPDGCTLQEPFSQDFSIVREIVFPQTEPGVESPKFSFSYNSDTTDQIDIHYQTSCSLGDTIYHNPSHGLGELSRVVTPTGAIANYTYAYDASYMIDSGSNAAANAITAKSLTHDGTTDNWSYIFSGGAPVPWNQPTSYVVVTNPDGSSLTQYSYPHFLGFHSSLGATGHGGLVYRTNQSDKILTERHWTRMVFSGANEITDGANKLVFNPVLDAEYTSLLELDSGGNPVAVKMSAKKYQYDYNGNLVQTTDYDWFDPSSVSRDEYGVPTGVPSSAQVLRVTNNSYYNSAPTAGSPNVYAKRSVNTYQPVILNAVQESTVGSIKTRFSYDRQPYGTAPTVGNLTTLSRWDDVTNSWISAVATYDSYGNVAITTDPKDNITQIFYEDATHVMPTRVAVDPQNGTGTQTSTTTYDFSTGAVFSKTDPNGAVSTIDYTNQLLGTVDPFGRPGAAFSPAVVVNGKSQRHKSTTIYEDHLRRVTSISDLNSEGDGLLKSRNTADELGRPVLSEQSENGSTYTLSSQTVYEQMGMFTYTSNPTRGDGAGTEGWTRSKRDILGRVIEVASFSGATKPSASQMSNSTGVVTTAYDAIYTTVTDQAGKVRRSKVNALGQLVRVDEPITNDNLGTVDNSSQPTSYTYDVLGNLTQVSQGVQTRTFTYSSLSRLTSATNPESHNQQGVPVPITYQYDANGNLTLKTDSRGVTTTYIYDALNRVTFRDYSDSTPDVTYTYDTATNGKGRLTSVSSSVSVYNYSGYDALGRVTGSSQVTDGVTYSMPNYQYDLAGNPTSQTYPSGRVVTTTYDNAGRLSQVSGQKPDENNKTYLTSPTYSAHGAMTEVKLGNNLWEHTSFNTRLQPTEIGLGTQPGGVDRLKLNYSYGSTNNNGNVLSQTITIPGGQTLSQSYTYDALNRLKSAEEMNGGSQSWKQTFIYDRYGNRNFDTTNTTANALGALLTIDQADNRFTAGQGSILYDSAGNLTRDFNGHAFGYDSENKQVSYDGGASANGTDYKYDGDGRRVKKVNGIAQATTVFVYSAIGQIVAEYDNSSSSSSGGTSYLTSDNLGTPRVITDSSGAVKARHDHLPFGEEIGLSGGRTSLQGYVVDNVRQKFTQIERDAETGLDYFLARYYSSSQGRFTSADPVLMTMTRLADPQAINLYVYVRNNPLKYSDPDGKEFVDENGNRINVKKNKKTGAIEVTGGRKTPKNSNVLVDLQRMAGLINKSGSRTATSQFMGLANNSTKIHFKIESERIGDPGLRGVHEVHDAKGNKLTWDRNTGLFNSKPAYNKNGEYKEATITIFEGTIEKGLSYERQLFSDPRITKDEAMVSTFAHEAEHDLNKKDIAEIKGRYEGRGTHYDVDGWNGAAYTISKQVFAEIP